MKELKKSQFLSPKDFKLYKICLKLARLYNEKVEDGCLVINSDEQVLKGIIEFNEDGIPGFGLKPIKAGYMHLFGHMHIDTIQDKKKRIIKVKKFVMPHTEDQIKDFFKGCRFVNRSHFEKI